MIKFLIKRFQKRMLQLLLVFSLLSWSSVLMAGAPQLVNKSSFKKSSRFVENKGQVTDQHGNLRNDVKYMYNAPGFSLALKENSFSYELIKVSRPENKETGVSQQNNTPDYSKFEKIKPAKIHSYRMDISFIGANPHPQILAAELQADKEIYYTSTGNSGSVVNAYKKLTYQNIYNNIDVVFYAEEEGRLKYDIIVKPGGRISDIKMQYDGVENLAIEAGKLIFNTPAGKAEESIPLSYIKENNVAVQVNYSLNQNIISFKNLNNTQINNSKTLVIDPVLKWATYYGGTAYEYGQATAVDKNGNVFLAGFTESTSNIASSGSHQTTRDLSSDAFLAKFSNSGARQWATYYGAGNYDEGRSVAVDENGNVFLAGYTYSGTGMSTSGAHQTTGGGDEDCFLVKFNSSGIRKWATYYGGSSWDYAGGIFADKNGNIFLSGETGSSSGISTTGAHQTSLSGGSDAFLVKFDSTGTRSWATYYGGTSTDAAYAVTSDDSGYIYLGGKTNSSASIATSGSHQSSLGGGSDAFLVKFKNTGARVWATYYGGSSADYGYSIAADRSGNIYLGGESSSTSAIAASAGFQSSKGSGTDGFLVKFNRAGTRQWGTYYGGSGGDNIISIITDAAENIMVSGNTQSTSGIATTGAHQTTYGGGTYDAFAAKIDRSGRRQWGTYYGGSSDDFANSVAVDAYSQVFMAGYTLTNSGMATSGAHQTTYGGNTDAFLSVFKDLCTIKAVLKAGKDTSFCVGRIESYTANKGSGLNYTWMAKGGTILYGQNKDSVVVRWDSAGRNYVQLQISPLSSCQDSAEHYINVIGLPKVVTGGSQSVCNGNINVGGSPVTGYTYSWKDLSSGKIISTSAGFNTTLSPGTYNYILDVTNASGCKNSDTAKITVLPKPSPTLSGDTVVCRNTTGHIYSTSNVSGNSYLWSVKGGTITSGQSTNSITVSWLNNGTGSLNVKVTNSSGCDSTVSFNNIKINPRPAPQIKGDITVCANTTGNIYSTSSVSGNNYTWSVTGGSISSGQGTNQVYISWGTSGTGTVEVKETNSFGCDTTVSISNIKINPRPSTAITGSAAVCVGTSAYAVKSVSGNNYVWKVAGGNIVNGNGTNAIKVNWINKGKGSVSVIESNSNGCKDSSLLNLTVNDLPKAIAGTASSICNGESIKIGANAVAGNSYTWTSVPAGFTSALANPLVQPSVTTTYYLTETNDSSGCSHNDSVVITVNSRPLPEIKGINNLCSGLMANYVAKKKTGNTYRWKINGENLQTANPDSINIGWNTSGINYITLIETNTSGCTDSVQMEVTVKERPVASVSGDTAVCLNKTASYKASSKNNAYNWMVTGGTIVSNNNDSITIIWDNEGQGFVKLVELNNNQCADSIILAVKVFNQAVAAFTAADVCEGETVSFINSSTNAGNYFWSFGDGNTSVLQNPVHTYAAPGTYQVKMIAINNGGCNDSITKQVQVFDAPESNFTFSISNTYDVDFMPQDTTQISYSWDFGDGASSLLKNPQHTYLAAGTYPVKLIVTAANNCKSEFNDTINIGTSGINAKRAGENQDINISIFPNPFTSESVLKYELYSNAKVNIVITDITGKNIITIADTYLQSGNYLQPISGAELSPGIYLVKMTVGETQYIRKLIRM